MANATHLDAGSEAVAHNLSEADKLEGMPPSHGKGEALASTEAHGGAEHVDPAFFGMNSTVIVSLAMLVFLAILLWKKVPALIGGMLDKKIDGIRTQLDEASKLRAEAEALKAEYEGKVAAAAKEADDMRARAEEEARLITAQAEKDATDLIARRQKMAEDRIGAAERAAVASVRAKAVQAATTAATQLIAANHDAGTDRALVDSTIKGIGTVN